MPSLNIDANSAKYQIRAFQPGLIQINDTTYHTSVIVSSGLFIDNWPPQHIHDVSAETLMLIIPTKPDILLIGTGSELVFPSTEIYGHLINMGIGVEIMNTGAACRTYNALTAENRNVTAALILR